jgi:cobalt/nickel transport system permease protein
MLLLHLGAVPSQITVQRSSFWHHLSDRIRVLCAILFVIATAFTADGAWWTWAWYGAGLLGLMLNSRCDRQTWKTLLGRVSVEYIFVASLLLGALFDREGQVLWQWQGLTLTDNGLTILGSVFLRTGLCLLMMNFLSLTMPAQHLFQALAALKMPPMLVAIASAMLRYLTLLTEEFQTLRQAAFARNLMGRPGWQRQIIGSMIGGLFIRTYDRGDRIHQAMLSRGYDGFPRPTSAKSLTTKDLTFLGMTILWLIGGWFMR